ncbi:MAG TPA: helix-turn-helix domain-containing protein [Candidatus Sulfopaludibacter sp.]|nr:helix-turn-helix domain-containing protein [Candidatus Sulfopaludibacter sp.]
MRVEHLLAAFAAEAEGLMGTLKTRHGITSAGWRAALVQLGAAPPERKSEEDRGAALVRDYLTPEEAAAALAIHVQTLRACVRSGKLPALPNATCPESRPRCCKARACGPRPAAPR